MKGNQKILDQTNKRRVVYYLLDSFRGEIQDGVTLDKNGLITINEKFIKEEKIKSVN
jgi:hypothetical protein